MADAEDMEVEKEKEKDSSKDGGPRFVVKKWCVRRVRRRTTLGADHLCARATCPDPRPPPPRAQECRDVLVVGHLHRHVRHLPQQAVRALDRGPSQCAAPPAPPALSPTGRSHASPDPPTPTQTLASPTTLATPSRGAAAATSSISIASVRDAPALAPQPPATRPPPAHRPPAHTPTAHAPPPLVRAARWLKTRSVCPLCNREWEFAKIEKIATYGNLD